MIRRFHMALLAVSLLAAPSAFAADAPAETCTTNSTVFLQAMVHGSYAQAGKDFNSTVAAALDADKLKQVWTRIQGQAGAFQKLGTPTQQIIAGHSVVVTRLTFANVPLNALVACDADGRINTFRLVPVPPDSAAISHAVRMDPNGVTSRSVQVQSPWGPLTGTLTLPRGNGPFAAVVLVGGSGPQDRDETIGPNKPFLDLAKGLAADGIASLRYDKRTLVYGAQISSDTSFTVDQEVTDDGLAALKVLAHQPHIDGKQLFVIGHSLGAMMAPRIGKQDPQLAGLVLMAAPARPLLDVLAEQERDQGRKRGATAAQITASENAIDAERKLLARADPAHPPKGTFGPAPQSYWLSLHDYHPLEVAKGLSMPMLILQGGRDFQVSPTLDFARWKQALNGQPNVTFLLYPKLSHLFMLAGSTGTVADYKTPGHVDQQVIHGIAGWIKQHS
ncbi:MAG: alpha/beta fold hydrolase [Rhodanobacter sp.]